MFTHRVEKPKPNSPDNPRRYARKLTIVLMSASTLFCLTVFYTVTAWSLEYTSTDEFCVRCHEMGKAYAEWKASSHYNNKSGIVASCADCHLPTKFMERIVAKAKYGAKDILAHYMGNPRDIDHRALAKSAQSRMPNDSCTRCHKKLFSPELSRGGFIAHSALVSWNQEADGADRTLRCVNCHENLVHQN